MLFLLCFSCLLLVSDIAAIEQEFKSENVQHANKKSDTEMKDFWKIIFTTYYDMKGLRNETTDDLVESFFEHSFDAYPQELYPAFKEIFVHISKSNDRIWNFYESILFLYHNVDAADRIHETMLQRLTLRESLKRSGDLQLDATLPLDDSLESGHLNVEHRSGIIFEEEPIPDFEQPCEDECGIPPLQVGSIRALPGVHFPNYDEIPITSFTCGGKHIPGFYADLETGCQVFHVCYPHRRESFLCPIGTTFNQAILACDYWYSSNCSLAPLYFTSGELTFDEYFTEGKESFVDHLLEQHGTMESTSAVKQPPADYTTKGPEDKSGKPKSPKIKITLPNIDWTLMIKFLPIKSKITECPDTCETTTHYPTKSTTIAEPTESSSRPVVTPTIPAKKDKYTTSTRPSVTPTVATVRPKSKYTTTTSRPVATPSPKKDKYGEKTGKSEILLDILKAVKLLTNDAEGFLSKMLENKRQHRIVSAKKKNIAPQVPTEKAKPFPEINPRFVVKPARPERRLPRPTVSRSKLIKPSKQSLKSEAKAAFHKKEHAKLVLGGLKAISHLFD